MLSVVVNMRSVFSFPFLFLVLTSVCLRGGGGRGVSIVLSLHDGAWTCGAGAGWVFRGCGLGFALWGAERRFPLQLACGGCVDLPVEFGGRRLPARLVFGAGEMWLWWEQPPAHPAHALAVGAAGAASTSILSKSKTLVKRMC
jgi:hypothetical protein